MKYASSASETTLRALAVSHRPPLRPAHRSSAEGLRTDLHSLADRLHPHRGRPDTQAHAVKTTRFPYSVSLNRASDQHGKALPEFEWCCGSAAHHSQKSLLLFIFGHTGSLIVR